MNDRVSPPYFGEGRFVPRSVRDVSRPGAEGELLDYGEPERSYESRVH